jgi:hypothetical protein
MRCWSKQYSISCKSNVDLDVNSDVDVDVDVEDCGKVDVGNRIRVVTLIKHCDSGGS